ncbi:MAG: VOC family protein [Acidimicrobiales bacterium]
MTLSIANVTFDCSDPTTVAGFWSAALGRPVEPEPAPGVGEFFASIAGVDGAPTLLFLKVPEERSVKNRVHVDLHADDRPAEVERLVALGATHHCDHDEFGLVWTTLLDVEGNEFCVAQH